MQEEVLCCPIHFQCFDQSFSPMSICKPPKPACSSVGPALLEQLDALYGYALALTQSQVEAEDLVQETCLRALRGAAQLRPDSHWKNWLFTILRHVFLNQRRSRQVRATTLSLEAEETPDAAWKDERTKDPQAVLVQQIERAQVQAALASLPTPYREVLVLREFENLSYQQMAEVLGCPIGTVMSRLGRAREKLKAALEQ